MPRESRWIYRGKKVELGWFESQKELEYVLRFRWNPEETRITYSALWVRADPSHDCHYVRVEHEGITVVELNWGFAESDPKEGTGEIDVINGENYIRVVVGKNVLCSPNPSHVILDVKFIYEWEGEEPSPPEGGEVEKWKLPELKWYHWLAIGMCAVGGGYVIGSALRRR